MVNSSSPSSLIFYHLLLNSPLQLCWPLFSPLYLSCPLPLQSLWQMLLSLSGSLFYISLLLLAPSCPSHFNRSFVSLGNTLLSQNTHLPQLKFTYYVWLDDCLSFPLPPNFLKIGTKSYFLFWLILKSSSVPDMNIEN